MVSPSNCAPFTEPGNTAAESNKDAAQGKEKEMEKAKCLSGFIFMCNPSTKLECYQYRVFGLPLGKKEVVEEIKPGTKLFLYDFQLKLLYGIYEATSAGKLNLEPAAFRGKFPAQVKFKIFKECLPLHEGSLRHVIQENYEGSKFKQELSQKQVRKLLSSFRPLTASSSQPAPQALANVSLSQAMPPSAMENQFRPITRPAVEVPYSYNRQFNRIPPLVEPEPVPFQHGYHRAAAYMEPLNPNMDHRSLPATSSYYVANSQGSSFAGGVAHGVQEPSYSRYIDERVPAPHDQVNSLERRYRAVEEMPSHDQVPVLERQYHQLPLQREAVYQDSVSACTPYPVAPNPYTSSAAQPQVHPPYYPMPVQRSSQYQDSAIGYNSNSAAPARYSASGSQAGVHPPSYHQLPLQGQTPYQDNVAAYNSYHSASAQYASSSATHEQVPAPGLSQGSAPITSYYAYDVANRL